MTGPTVTIDTSPPTALVTFTEANLAPSISTLTLYRIADGVTAEVRNGVRAFAVGGVVISDAELPIGVPVTYRGRQYDADGNDLGITDSTTVDVPADTAYYGWISDPLDTTQAFRVVMADGAGQNPKRVTPGTVHRVGARTVVLAGQRGLLEDLNMDFFTETDEDRNGILALLNSSGGIILIRTAPPMLVPRLLYCFAPSPTPTLVDTGEDAQAAAWTNTVQEISPVTGGTVRANVSWQTYMDAYGTWAAIQAVYPTWLAAAQNPPES